MKPFNWMSSHLIRPLMLCLALSSCALIPKPDTCECSGCPLESSPDDRLTQLKEIQMGITYAGEVVEVCACRPWNRSLIKVEKDQAYVFSVLEKTEEWLDGSVAATPETGWLNPVYTVMGSAVGFLKRSNKANWYALVGTVELSDEDSFAIFETGHGSHEGNSPSLTLSPSIVMRKGGELYFYANDMPGRYFNNKGVLRLQIQRIM